jgi:hypothetical protein
MPGGWDVMPASTGITAPVMYFPGLTGEEEHLVRNGVGWNPRDPRQLVECHSGHFMLSYVEFSTPGTGRSLSATASRMM